jgi:hypothetical protein
MSVYALLGDWWSSDRLRKASDAETVGRRSVASKSMILGLLNVAVARPNGMVIEREKKMKERRGDSRDIHTGRGGSLCSIRAVRTRRVDGGIWRDSHCLPYYVTDHMYSCDRSNLCLSSRVWTRLLSTRLSSKSCMRFLASSASPAAPPSTPLLFALGCHHIHHSHKPEETSRLGVNIMLYHCCSNIRFVTLG